MAFFERLRQRLRRRRLERKLQDLSRAGSRAQEPRDLLASRVKIKPLDAGNATVLTVESSSVVEPVQPFRSQSQLTTQPLDPALLRFVASYNVQSFKDFRRECKVLKELQEFVPQIRMPLLKWAEWNARSQEVVLRSTRDVKRWRIFHENAQTELRSIHSHVLKVLVTRQNDRKFTAQRIHTTAMIPKLSPQSQVLALMVSVALVAGVYGLLILAAFLKFKKKI